MTTPELEALLQKLVSNWNKWKDEEGLDYEDAVNRPPATPEQIANLERWLGRSLSPCYRYFLSVQNGLVLGNEYVLLGTEDYATDSARKSVASMNRIFFQLLGEDILDWHWLEALPDSVFEPQNLYPVLDGKAQVPAELQGMKDFSDRLRESREAEDFWLFFPHHIVIGYSEDVDFYKLLDCHEKDETGEMPIQHYSHGDWGETSENIYEYLKGRLFEI